MNYEETLDYLFKQLPMYQRQGKIALKKDLSNTLKMCSILNNPQHKFKSIHIAGTNGKGSTAHMLASVFQEAGYLTGLYTSPHLKDFRERIRLNGEPINKREVTDFVKYFHPKFKSINPSFFEWTVALSFYVFAKKKVDIAIVETGLGGRLDSTNVILPELSIITNIGYDHVDILGKTLSEIATEKAGIIKPQVPIIVGDHSGEPEVFLKEAEKKGAPLIFGNNTKIKRTFKIGLLGNYQQKNAKTAFQAIQLLQKQGYSITQNHFHKGLLNVVKNTGLRGRWEILQQNPTIIAETAHNKEALIQVLSQLKEISPNQLHFTLGFVADKKIESLLELFPKEANYYFCQADIPRALDHLLLKEKAKQVGLFGNSYPSVKKAIQAAKKSAQITDTVYVGGSNFVVAEVL